MIPVIITGLLIRVCIIFSGEYHSDMDYYRAWGVQANVHGFCKSYEPVDHYRGVEYPPLNPYLFFFMDKLCNGLKKVFGEFDAFYYLHKFFLLFIDLLIGIILLRQFDNYASGKFSLKLFFLNPGIIVCTVLWGQTDNLLTLFLLLSVLAASKSRAIHSGFWFGLASLAKIQAPIFAPLIVMFFLIQKRNKDLLKFVGTAFVVYFIFALPFVFNGSVDKILSLYFNSSSFHPYMSANAYNLQWLLSGGNGFQPDTMKVFSIIRADILGWILFAGAYVLVFFTLKKESSAKSLFLCASFITFAFYMLPTQMHERYFFSFFVFFLFIPPETGLQRGLYILSSALFFINVFSVFGVHRKYFCSFTEQYGTMLSVVTASLSLTIFVILAIMMAMGSFVDFKQNVHNPESSQSLYH